MLAASLLATGIPAEAAQRDDSWGPVGPGELRTPKRARRAGERMIEQAQADRTAPERDARRGAAASNADAQAKCLAAVQRRLEQGRTEAARKRMERCRRRHDVSASRQTR